MFLETEFPSPPANNCLTHLLVSFELSLSFLKESFLLPGLFEQIDSAANQVALDLP